jgi:hypothetical protein
MKHPLRVIEKRLQDFFEYQLQNLAGKDLYKRITETLVDTVEQSITEREGQRFAPNIFRIKLEGESQIEAEELAEFAGTLKSIITTFCDDELISLAGPLHIQFFKDAKIEDGFRIESAFSSPPAHETARIVPDQSTASAEQKIIAGYLISQSDEIFEIRNPVINIGRREDNQFVIDNLLVSRLHAQIRSIQGEHIIFDLDSSAGTRVNGQRIRQQPLSPGDVIEFADTSLIYYRELDDPTLLKSGGMTRKII